MAEPLDIPPWIRHRQKQIDKFKGERCCVCGKYGAAEQFGEPVHALVLFARDKALTLKLPSSNAIHEKCLKKLKEMVNNLYGRTRIQT